jgi:hypothetical protein
MLTAICAGAAGRRSRGRREEKMADVLANTPVILEQLQKSGVRLAHLLDAALGK